MPFLSPNQQCQRTEGGGNISHSMDLLTPSSSGVFELCVWPLVAPGYLGGGLPCLSSALWFQYHKSSQQTTQSLPYHNTLAISHTLTHCVLTANFHRLCKAPAKSPPPSKQHPVFLQDGCPSCRPTNSVKAQKGISKSFKLHVTPVTQSLSFFVQHLQKTSTDSTVLQLLNETLSRPWETAKILGNC